MVTRESMTARLQSILADAEIPEAIQDQLAVAGLTTLGLFASMGSDDKAVREFLADVVGLDPAAEQDRAIRGQLRMNITRICSAFMVSKTANEVEVRHNAERSTMQLPLVISTEEFTACRNAFERIEYKLTEEISPSKPYFERKITELSNEFKAEHLTTVTTGSQEETGQQAIPQVDPKTGFFRMATKSLGIEMPRNAEEFRVRWETLGACLWYVKARSPTRRVLQTVTMARHDSILKWLFGPEVWGLATKGIDGIPISTPTFEHVLVYELALRREVARLMNSGVTWWEAWNEAMNNTTHKQTHFLIHVAVKPAGVVSAPGMRAPSTSVKAIEAPPAPHAQARPGEKTRSQKNNDRKKRQLAVLKDYEAEAKRARGNGGGNGAQRLAILDRQNKGGGKGAKGAKGAKVDNRFPEAAMRQTAAGEPICINHNKTGCTRQGCIFKHVCWFCESADHNGANHPR